jgi:hypothetical protein
MTSSVEEHVLYRILNAPICEYPYPHIYVENVFPEAFYTELRRNWPDAGAFVPLGDTGRVPRGAYPERFVIPITEEGVGTLAPERRPFWMEFGQWFTDQRFCMSMIRKFERQVYERLGDDITRCHYGADALAVRDHTNYSIGPHTDAPHRLVTMLFYCPEDDSHPHLGTTIYWPLKDDFRCRGGPHYPFDRFKAITTMPYKRNSLFAFFKDERSFHGVAPIPDRDIVRDLMLYDVRVYDTDR